jgi:hypothetical protein
MPRRLLALTAACLAGCGGDSTPKDTIVASGSAAAVAPPGNTVRVTTHRRGGTPHHAAIDLVALSGDGAAAISRDVIGEWRVWPALDGTRPTQRLPLTGAQDAEIAATKDGFVVGAVDAADSLELLVLDADGATVERNKLPPDPGIERLALVGGIAVASRADQSIVVLDAHARVLGTLALRGTRVEGLVAAGDRALAILRKSGATPTFEGRWLELAAKPAWGASFALPAPPAAGTGFTLSPDRRLLAYTTAPLPPVPAPASAPEPAGKKDSIRIPVPAAPPQLPSAVSIALYDVVRARTIAIADPATLLPGAVIGFMADREILVADPNQGFRIAIDADAATTSTFGDGLPVRTGPTAFAPGLAAAGQLSSLVIVTADGNVRYLGHRDSAPVTGALSPSGRTAAWLSSAGTLIVERLDEDAEHVITPDSHTAFSLVELIDDATVIVLSNSSVLQMYDIDSGKLLGDTPVMSASAVQFSAKTRLLLVPSGATVWVYEVDRTAPAPFGKRMVVPEVTAFLLDPDAAGGAVLLGSDGGTIRVRRHGVDGMP